MSSSERFASSCRLCRDGVVSGCGERHRRGSSQIYRAERARRQSTRWCRRPHTEPQARAGGGFVLYIRRVNAFVNKQFTTTATKRRRRRVSFVLYRLCVFSWPIQCIHVLHSHLWFNVVVINVYQITFYSLKYQQFAYNSKI